METPYNTSNNIKVESKPGNSNLKANLSNHYHNYYFLLISGSKYVPNSNLNEIENANQKLNMDNNSKGGGGTVYEWPTMDVENTAGKYGT